LRGSNYSSGSDTGALGFGAVAGFLGGSFRAFTIINLLLKIDENHL